MSICFLFSVLNLLTPSWKQTDCLLWSLTVMSQWHMVAMQCHYLRMNVTTFWFMVNSVCWGVGSGTACWLVLATLQAVVFWSASDFSNCFILHATDFVHHTWQNHYCLQVHQLLMWKPTRLIIHQYGFLVSNYNYDIVWRFRHLEKCIMEIMSCYL